MFSKDAATIRMFMLRSGFAFLFLSAPLCLGGPLAHAQSGPLSYWTPGWPVGFAGNSSGEGANTYGNFPGFDATSGNTRFNFGNGWFVGSERGGLGGLRLGMSGFGQGGAFGSFQAEGAQFGYNFRNSPVTFYAGFDSLKYNPGIGSALTPFDSTSSTVGGYGAHAGVEFKPTSNLSLQFGVGYTQSGRIDTDSQMPSLSNASQYDLVGGRH
jgi:opacity protein-like surface antigen